MALPEWARPFVEYNPAKAGTPGYDAMGYALPFVDANGQFSMSPNTSRPGDSYARLLPGGSWGYDPEGNALAGPRLNEDGAPILMDAEGNRIAEEVPYWDPSGLYEAVAGQYGAGAAAPLQDVQNFYNRSEIPGAGISYDQFLNRQYVNPRVVDVPGMGQFVAADSRNEFDWGLGDRSSFMDTLLGRILPAFAGAAGLNSLLTNGLGGLTGSAGMPGMAEGYGAIEASMGTPIGAADAVAAAAPAGGGYSIGVPDVLSSAVPSSLGGTAPQIGGAVSIGAPEALASALPSALGGAGVDFGAGALNAAAAALPAAAAGTAAGTAAGQAATSGLGGMLNGALGTNLTSGDMDLIGRLLGTGLGAIGANQQANAQQDMFQQFMGLGAPYRASLASLEANPSAYYQSPEVQGALQQGSDALARSLSAKVGNPILNPTAMQEMQNYTTQGLLGQLNQRRNFLAGAGGLGVNQAAPLGAQAAQGQGNVFNALGAGVNTVFGQDPYQQMASALKNVFSLS